MFVIQDDTLLTEISPAFRKIGLGFFKYIIHLLHDNNKIYSMLFNICKDKMARTTLKNK